MSTPRGSADSTWPRPGLKALSTLSLGFYNNRTQSFPVFSRAESLQPNNPFEEPSSVDNVRYNPDARHLIESLKVVMMNLRHNQTIPIQHNYTVNILIERLENALCEEKAKDQQVEEAKAEAEAAKKHLEEKVKAWNILEADYKQEVKNLELIIAGGKRGLEIVTLARSNTRLRDHRKAFKKTISNLSSIQSSEKADEDGLKRQNTKSRAVSSSKRQSQVFDHKRTSKASNDKLLADFGTLMDSQLSQSIQHHDDELAGAARRNWTEARKRDGHTGYSSPSESSEGKGAGLGLTLYDPPLVQQDSVKDPLPPPVIVEPETENIGEDDDEDDGDDAEELAKIPGGGFMMKPKKRGAGSRAKSFFGLGKKKAPKHTEPEVQDSDSSSPSSSDSDGRGSRSVARALASINAMASTIASPMPGIERARTPPNKTSLQPPKNLFKRAKKPSHTNLPALAQHFMHGMKKVDSAKSDKFKRSEESARPTTKYDKSMEQLNNIIPPERRAYSEAFKSSTNFPTLTSNHRGREDILPQMADQPSRSISLEVPTMRQEVLMGNTAGAPRRYHGSVKKRGRPQNLGTRSASSLRREYDVAEDTGEEDEASTAHRSISNLRREYHADDDDDDDDDDNVPTYGKSNSVRGSFEERRMGTAAPFPPRTTSAMGLGTMAEGHAQEVEGQREDRIVASGYTAILPRSQAPDRVYDPRLPRQASRSQFDDTRGQSCEAGEQTYPMRGQKVLIDRVKSQREERDEVEAASRRLLMRASGHKFIDDGHASWEQEQDRPETFRTAVICRQSTVDRGGDHERPISMASVITVLRNPRESLQGIEKFMFPTRDDKLIRGRSERSGREDGAGLANRDANGGSVRREVGPGRAGEENISPYFPSKDILRSIADRDEEIQYARQTKYKPAFSLRRPKESSRGDEDFLLPLRSQNAMLPASSGFGGRAGGSRLLSSGSAKCLSIDNARGMENHDSRFHPPVVPNQMPRRESDTSGEGEHTPPSDESAIIVRKPRKSIRGNEDFLLSLGGQKDMQHGTLERSTMPEISRVSSSGSQSRPVTAIYQGQNAEADRSPCVPSADVSHAFGNLCGGGQHTRNLGTASSATWRDPTASNQESDGPLQPPKASSSAWRYAISSDQERDELPFRPLRARDSLTMLRRGGSKQDMEDDGGRIISNASNGSLPSQRRGERRQSPQLPRAQNELNMLRRGGSGQYGRSGAHITSSEPGSNIRRSMADIQTRGEQGETQSETQSDQIDPASESSNGGSQDRVFSTSSTSSLHDVLVLPQEKGERPLPAHPSRSQNELNLLSRRSSVQHDTGTQARIMTRDSRTNLRSAVGQREASGERKELCRPSDPALPGANRPIHDRVVSNASTASTTSLDEPREPKQQRSQPPRGQNELNMHRRGGSGQHGGGTHARTPSGAIHRGNMGQRQPSGEQGEATNISINPALAAARRVADDAAKKKLLEKEVEKKK